MNMDITQVNQYRNYYTEPKFTTDLDFYLNAGKQRMVRSLQNPGRKSDSLIFGLRVINTKNRVSSLAPMIINDECRAVIENNITHIDFYSLGKIFADEVGEEVIPFGAFYGGLGMTEDVEFPNMFVMNGGSINGQTKNAAFFTDVDPDENIIPLLKVEKNVIAIDVEVSKFLDGYYSKFEILLA